MPTRRVRPVFFMILGLVAMAGIVIPVAIDAAEGRTQRIRAQMMAVAQAVQIPAGVVVQERNDCRGDGGLVACWSSQQEPAELASAFQSSLSQAAKQQSTMSCETLPYGSQPQSCLVRFDRSGHAVLMWIDANVTRDRTGALAHTGSLLRIDVY
jgi:hypothetical protein